MEDGVAAEECAVGVTNDASSILRAPYWARSSMVSLTSFLSCFVSFLWYPLLKAYPPCHLCRWLL